MQKHWTPSYDHCESQWNSSNSNLRYQTSEPPLTNKNSYPETYHPHMAAIIIWIGLITDISGIGNLHWDSHWPHEGLQYDSQWEAPWQSSNTELSKISAKKVNIKNAYKNPVYG